MLDLIIVLKTLNPKLPSRAWIHTFISTNTCNLHSVRCTHREREGDSIRAKNMLSQKCTCNKLRNSMHASTNRVHMRCTFLVLNFVIHACFFLLRWPRFGASIVCIRWSFCVCVLCCVHLLNVYGHLIMKLSAIERKILKMGITLRWKPLK